MGFSGGDCVRAGDCCEPRSRMEFGGIGGDRLGAERPRGKCRPKEWEDEIVESATDLGPHKASEKGSGRGS